MDPDAEEDYTARIFACHACAARETAMAKFTGKRAGKFVVVERRR